MELIDSSSGCGQVGRITNPAFRLIAAACILSVSHCLSAQESPADAVVEAPVPGEARFTEGSLEPSIDLSRSPRARQVLEVARLSAETARAFDRGDAALGRRLAREAAGKLVALEQEELQRGDGAARSRLATQRARLLLDYANDRRAAKEALFDAVGSDEKNGEAQRVLLEVLDREEVEAAQNRRNER